jgi:hypothetical protein
MHVFTFHDITIVWLNKCVFVMVNPWALAGGEHADGGNSHDRGRDPAGYE